MKKAIFLDRDGVINEERKGFVYKKEDVFIFPWVLESLKILKDKGYLIIVVTNQPSIARGLVSEEGIRELHKYINKELKGLIDTFYFCPHHPEIHDDVPEYAMKYRISCKCRKPSEGMLLQASKDFDINLKESWMIGDMVSDIVAGKRAGCKTITIKSYKNKEIIKSDIDFNQNEEPDFYANNLFEAAVLIS